MRISQSGQIFNESRESREFSVSCSFPNQFKHSSLVINNFLYNYLSQHVFKPLSYNANVSIYRSNQIHIPPRSLTYNHSFNQNRDKSVHNNKNEIVYNDFNLTNFCNDFNLTNFCNDFNSSFSFLPTQSQTLNINQITNIHPIEEILSFMRAKSNKIGLAVPIKIRPNFSISGNSCNYDLNLSNYIKNTEFIESLQHNHFYNLVTNLFYNHCINIKEKSFIKHQSFNLKVDGLVQRNKDEMILNKLNYNHSSNSYFHCVSSSKIDTQFHTPTTTTHLVNDNISTSHITHNHQLSNHTKLSSSSNELLHFLSFNCRSIRNKIHGVMSYIEEKQIEIACLQETWLNLGDKSLYQIIQEYGYKTITKERRDARGGGVAILYKPNLKIKKMTLNIMEVYTSFEYVCCTLCHNKNYINLVNLYRPPYSRRHQCTVKIFNQEFQSFLSLLLELKGDLLLVGDFNINLNGKHDENVLNFLRSINENNLLQISISQTHIKGGILDLVIVNKNLHDTGMHIDTDTTFHTDHYPILINLLDKPDLKDENVIIRRVRQLINLETEKFEEDLKLQPVTDLEKYINLSPAELIELYNSTMEQLVNKHCPLKIKKYRPKHIKSKWYNAKLQRLKQEKRRAERRYKKSKIPDNKRAFTEIRNQYNFEIKESRAKFYQDKIASSKSDLKQLYGTLDKLLGCTKERITPTNKDDKTITKEMAEFYVHKINNIRYELNSSNTYNLNIEANSNLSNIKSLTHFSLINSEDLMKIIKSMKNKTCRSDPIPTAIVKKNINNLIHILTRIVNSCILENTFPDSLKNALVTPIIKDQSKSSEDYKNYRPVSDLPFLSKVLEQVIYQQLSNHIEINGLHCKYQSSYRKHHSCETSMIRMVGDIQSMVGEGMCVILVLLDNSAAFDTVDHRVLLYRLEHQYKVKNEALNMIKSYLNGRTFSVMIGDKVGDPEGLRYGVPQGSILGPLFYLLYTKELEKIVENHGLKVSLYADDVQVYFGFKAECIKLVQEKLEKCIVSIMNWMKANFLKLNPDKTMIKFFTPDKQKLNHEVMSFHLNFGNTTIHPSKSIKVLGVILGAKLNFQTFISNKIRTCNYHLRNLRNIKTCLPTKIRIQLVNTLILSTLDYCNALFACLPECHIYPLQKVMNKAVRFIFNLKYDTHISPFLFKLHFLPIKFRIKFKLCLIAFKIRIGTAPLYLLNTFEFFQPSTTIALRHGVGRDELMMKINLAQMKNLTVLSKIIIEWNDLPFQIRNISDIEIFKTQLKTHFFKKAFDNFL